MKKKLEPNGRFYIKLLFFLFCNITKMSTTFIFIHGNIGAGKTTYIRET